MSVMITGCTGTLGKTLIRYLLSSKEYRHKNLKIFGISRDELKQAELKEELAEDFPSEHKRVNLQLADVRDAFRLPLMFTGKQVVIHTAALKRVDSVSFSPEEVIKTNVLGTMNVLRAAHVCGVKKMLFISTDKAVEPINIYGASKMMAENLVTSYNQYCYQDGMAASVARYGNVWGSRGSFLSIWRKAINAGTPIPITDAQMSRFVWKQHQAADFIDLVLGNMEGGEIFVPDCPSVWIEDVFRALQRQTGYFHLTSKIVGLRPGGEKQHETLIANHELPRTAGYMYDELSVFVILPYLHPWRDGWAHNEIGEVLNEPLTSDSMRHFSEYAFNSDSAVKNKLDELVKDI